MEAKREMDGWDICAVKNGWTDGFGYGYEIVKDMNERFDSEPLLQLFVNDDYPICSEV